MVFRCGKKLLCLVSFLTYRDRTVYIQYSKHQELKTPQVSSLACTYHYQSVVEKLSSKMHYIVGQA